MVQEVTVTLLKLANTQTNKQTNLQGIYFIKGLTPFSTANTPQYEFFKFFVGMDQWWISLQPSSSCKSSTWSSAPQCCSAEMTTDLQRVLSWWKIWVNRWKFCVVQVDLFFFNERNGKSYWYPFAGIILQSMKWSFFLKKISSIFFHLEKLFYDEVALLLSPCFMQSWMNPWFPTIARIFCFVSFFT